MAKKVLGSDEKCSELFPLSLLPLYPSATDEDPTRVQVLAPTKFVLVSVSFCACSPVTVEAVKEAEEELREEEQDTIEEFEEALSAFL